MTELALLPIYRETRVVVGTTVRKSLPVLQHYLASLDAQQLPARTTIKYCFVPDYPEPDTDAELYLRDWTANRGGMILRGLPTNQSDFSDAAGSTHFWTGSAMQRVGEHKNRILDYAHQIRADAVFFADADLLMDATTLWSLLHVDFPIVCAVYWTRWHQNPTGPKMPAMPQVWLRHPYDLSGRGLEEAEFRRNLVDKDLTQVWGQGACTLIRPRVWEAGINFSMLPDLPTEGMWQGEDRHFCVKAERAHIPMFADPWPDIFHQYHLPADIELAQSLAPKLLTAHDPSPKLGWWMNLILQPLEPVPQADGRYLQVGPQYVRGRLGALPLLPELEDAVAEMKRGDVRLIACHPGWDHPVPYLRGRRRLIRVTLVDTKPFGQPPVLADDLYVSTGGAWRYQLEEATA